MAVYFNDEISIVDYPTKVSKIDLHTKLNLLNDTLNLVSLPIEMQANIE